jgi:hypothetical protein
MRRQYITHPRFQFAFTATFVTSVVLIFAILGGITVATMVMLARDPLVSEAQRAILNGATRHLLATLGLSLLVAIITFSLGGIYLSYKFVGPLYRLENWLEDRLAGEEFSPLILRPGDELVGVVGLLNDILPKKKKS